ncbi:DUF397 domain-containing protein [Streptomyces cellulosae]|uniref:DUF397 domain-containing protein n=1 Tax=Streptomyces cellulosae TaxID=1968 RepID=A0ABW7Y228_STRCE
MKRTPDLSTAVWRKSSYSDGGGTNCVEIAHGYANLVPVRDSKVPDGQVLVFGAAPWTVFLAHTARSV